jgi:tetratricopeptide (TPR) repeat protein
LTSAILKRGDTERAEELLVNSNKVVPGNPVVLEMLLKLRMMKKDWVGAEDAIVKLKKLPQGEFVAQIFSGILAQKQGNHLDAIQVYKYVLSKNPNASGALSRIGQSYITLGQRAEFILYLKSFIETNPDNIPAYNVLGQTYALDKKWSEASKILQQALTLDPKSSDSYRVLAAVFIQQGKMDDALTLYRKGLDMLPENPELMMALAKYFVNIKNFEEATASYENLLSKFPNNDEAANNLADLLLITSDDPGTIKRAQVLTERFKDSQNPYFLDTYGWVLFKSGAVDKSITVLKKTVLAAPDNAIIRYHLGVAYHSAGDHGASKVELEKSLSLVKKNNEFEGIDRVRQLLKEIGGSANS